MYSQSRPFLEQYVREFLFKRGNVHLCEACEVVRLLITSDSGQVTGVLLRYRNGEQREEELAADLVVDASGRGSRAPRWLTSLGYTQVEEESMKVDVAYATRIYRCPSHLSYDWKMVSVAPTPPDGGWAGLIALVEGERWMVTLASYRQTDLPDEDSFLDYARNLPRPDLYEFIKDAEPLTPVLIYKYSANRWRHYERMPYFPEGFVILGDAMCSFNPVYGQGMTVAALEAKMLDASLRRYFRSTSRQERSFAQQFQKDVAKMVEWPWRMATGADLFYMNAQVKQTWGKCLLDWYMLRLGQLTMSDPLVAERFNEVLHMLKMPTALFAPRIAWAIFKHELASRKPQVAVSLPSGDSGSLAHTEPRHALP